jgi:hypothetical protein
MLPTGADARAPVRTASERLHQIAPRFAENGDLVGCHRIRTAQDRARNPRSATTDHDYRQLRRRVLYPLSYGRVLLAKC